MLTLVYIRASYAYTAKDDLSVYGANGYDHVLAVPMGTLRAYEGIQRAQDLAKDFLPSLAFINQHLSLPVGHAYALCELLKRWHHFNTPELKRYNPFRAGAVDCPNGFACPRRYAASA